MNNPVGGIMDEIFTCCFCSKDHEQPFYFNDDYDQSWCSEECVLSHEAAGISKLKDA